MIEMAKENTTTIQISKDAKEMLREFGKMGETYDDVIRKLINIAKEVRRNESKDS